MDKLSSRYIMIDYQMPTKKFYAMPAWAGSSEDKFFETYYQPIQDGKLEPITLFYPAYYRSIVVRLYNFDGKAIVPKESIVISYEKKTNKEGVWYKEITGSKSFSTYEAAAEYLASHKSGNYRIVSPNPCVSPMPLEELKRYKLVHESDATATIAGKQLPEVKIFEYAKLGKS